MANLRNFDGKEDAMIWLTDFDVFCSQLAPNITDDQKLQMAQVRLSPEVDGCRQSVAAKMQLVFRAEWIQTWPRVRAILIAISGQIRLVKDQKSRARTQAVKKGIAITGGGLLVGIAMPIAFLGVMGSVSIGVGGAAAGTIVAKSSIGAGSIFAFCRSAAAGGAAMATVTAASAGLAGTATAAGNIANLRTLKEVENQSPSGSWGDGKNFVPHQDVLLFLMQNFP